MTRVDSILDNVAEVGGWPTPLRLKLLEGVHLRFVPAFRAIISDGKTKDKFDPLFRYMNIGLDEASSFSAIERHINYQIWRFNEAPVLGARSTSPEIKVVQCTLKDIYVPLDCGILRWDAIGKMQKAESGTEKRKSPFDEAVGGRSPMLEHIVKLIGDDKFREAIVVQGVAGAGKSAFTLNLCIELRKLGLRPVRIRMRDLALDPRTPLLDDLAQAIVQNSGDETFDKLRGAVRPAATDLKMSHIFDESVIFGSAQICPHVLIFDGWDEISVSASEGFRQRIEETLRAIRRDILGGRSHRLRIVLTGRPSFDVEESRFLQSDTPVLTVRPFTEDQLKTFSAALLEYRIKNGPGDRVVLSKRIQNLVQHRARGGKSVEEGKLGILGLPLLAMLAIWLSLNDDSAPLSIGSDETTLYRRLVDLTCKHGGNVEEITTAPRFIGDQLRELLRRTAAAMTMRGTEHISYTELERRLKDSGAPASDELIREITRNNPIANLMISFFFNVGSREHGCEFIHKTFREYLFAECIVESLKSIGGSLSDLPLRAPYWKDFSSDDPRCNAVRRLATLLAAQWLMPEVARHLHALLSWEIERSNQDGGMASDGHSGTTIISSSAWENTRDLLADLWDWWGEGVHLRPQPFIGEDTGALAYREPFVFWLARAIAPADLPRGRLPEPVRAVTIDAHLGDALFQIACTVHFAINKATGWLEPGQRSVKKNAGKTSSLPELFWSGASPRVSRRYQTHIKREDGSWIAFAPGTPDGNNNYIREYIARINAAGWRPEGEFPGGIDMSGINLAGSQFERVSGSIYLQYANLSRVRLEQSNLASRSNFESCLAHSLLFGLTIGGSINFRNADLRKADFGYAFLLSPDFAGAIVEGAGFRGATLGGVNRQLLAGADISNVRFEP